MLTICTVGPERDSTKRHVGTIGEFDTYLPSLDDLSFRIATTALGGALKRVCTLIGKHERGTQRLVVGRYLTCMYIVPVPPTGMMFPEDPIEI